MPCWLHDCYTSVYMKAVTSSSICIEVQTTLNNTKSQVNEHTKFKFLHGPLSKTDYKMRTSKMQCPMVNCYMQTICNHHTNCAPNQLKHIHSNMPVFTLHLYNSLQNNSQNQYFKKVALWCTFYLYIHTKQFNQTVRKIWPMIINTIKIIKPDTLNINDYC